MKITDTELCDKIDEFMINNGYCPTVRDILDMTPLTSPASVFHRLRTLSKRGKITFIPESPRTIVTASMKERLKSL